MEQANRDHWAEWLLRRRFAGDEAERAAAMRTLFGYRDRVLANSGLREGGTLLDVGAGDGLIGFGALDLVGPQGEVIFSDVSQDLLDICAEIAREMGALERCRFVRAPAQDLSQVASGSVDAVTTRSVLIYVKEKAQAFAEFYRVLRPGGRISLFEPINAFASVNEEDTLGGADVTPVRDLAARVRQVYRDIQPPNDPMLDFDERDLLSLAEAAGFGEIHLEYEANIEPAPPRPWDTVLKMAANPLVPTFEEAIGQVLTEEEAERLMAHLRPIVEPGGSPVRRAAAYMWARKPVEA